MFSVLTQRLLAMCDRVLLCSFPLKLGIPVCSINCTMTVFIRSAASDAIKKWSKT